MYIKKGESINNNKKYISIYKTDQLTLTTLQNSHDEKAKIETLEFPQWFNENNCIIQLVGHI